MREDGDTSDRLIQDAYGVVSKPERLLRLLENLQDEDAAPGGDMVPMAQHFARITEMIDEIDPNIGDDFAGFTVPGEDADTVEGGLSEPQLVLDRDGRVVALDSSFFDSTSIQVDGYLPSWMTEIDAAAYRKLMAEVRAQSGQAPSLLRLRMFEDDEAGQLFSVSPRADNPGHVDLRVIRLRWHESSGSLFAQVLRLTKTEAQLTRYVVDGLSIRQFAEARGRSLGTARNQLKALLRKLSLGSQIELVTLYAGFHASMMLKADALGSTATQSSGQVLHLANGHELPFETHGDPSGKPVIFLHATADGAYLTPSQDAAAKASGLKVIAPWLPYYAGSTMDRLGLEVIDAFVDRLEALQDHLGIAGCPVITVRVAAPYGFAAIQRDPKRFTGLVTAGAVTPAMTKDHFAHLALGYRAPMRLAQIAPSFVRLYFAATAAMVRKGEGQKFFRSLYGNSPADLAMLDDPEVVETMRRSLQRTFEDGYESTLQQTLLSAGDWSNWCEGISAPVRMICGKEDGLAPPHQVQEFCERHGFEMIGPLDNIGSLAMHQVPRLVFDTAASWT